MISLRPPSGLPLGRFNLPGTVPPADCSHRTSLYTLYILCTYIRIPSLSLIDPELVVLLSSTTFQS